MVGRQSLKLLVKVRPLLPELAEVIFDPRKLLRGCLIGRTSGSEPAGVGSTPTSGTETDRLGRQLADHLCLNQRMLWVQLPLEPQILIGGNKVTKRGSIQERLKHHGEALTRAAEYLVSEAHGHWHGFRPLFVQSNRLPHRDWVTNVFVRRRKAAVTNCESALETIERKAKERRVNQFRRQGKEYLSSWSSLECSPPCQGGGRGFKSHRGRLARYANW